MKKKPDNPEIGALEIVKELHENLHKNLRRRALWNKAAEKYLKLPPDGILELAIEFENWRDLERRFPKWRELWRGPEQSNPEQIEKVIQRLEIGGLSWLDIKENLQFQDRIDKAAAFEERHKKAALENDHVFLSRWAEAAKMLDGGVSIKTSAAGFVLLAWRDLGGLALFHKSPTRKMIEQWVEDRRKKGGITSEFSVRTWQRTWAEPLVKALLKS
jgi:hypothetical protein